MRRVLLTGAGGFLGREVAAQLTAGGDDVVAIVRPGSTSASALTAVPLDLATDFSADLKPIGALDAVIHLAQAPGWHDFPQAAGTIAALSVTATCRLAEYACAVGATSLVYASSGGVYGPSDGLIAESAPLKPAAELGFYLGSKTAGETLLAYFAGSLAVQVLRPFFLYGPGQSPAFLMPRLWRSVAEGAPIRAAAGRGPRLNPLYVADAARAVAAASLRSEPLTANLAGAQAVTVAEIAAMIGTIQGRDPVFVTTGDLAGDYVADTQVMTRLLATPQVDLAEGLRAMGAAS